MQTNLNMSLTNRTFAILGVCGIDFQSSVQNGKSKNSLRSVRYGLKQIMRNDSESVLSQSSLGNAMEKCSAIEYVFTLTYLNNIHLHMQVCQIIFVNF